MNITLLIVEKLSKSENFGRNNPEKIVAIIDLINKMQNKQVHPGEIYYTVNYFILKGKSVSLNFRNLCKALEIFLFLKV
jgi:hypothetical protein